MDKFDKAIEVWKPVIGYKGAYEVSDLGRIKSLARTIMRSNGKTLYVRERIIKPSKDKKGYLRFCLSKNGVSVTCKVHRIVAQSFIPNPYDYAEVNHITGNKLDNSISNLEWVSHSKNVEHSVNNGLYKRTPQKLSQADVENIRKLYIPYSRKFGTNALSKMFGVDSSYVWRIIKHKKRKDLRKEDDA